MIRLSMPRVRSDAWAIDAFKICGQPKVLRQGEWDPDIQLGLGGG